MPYLKVEMIFNQKLNLKQSRQDQIVQLPKNSLKQYQFICLKFCKMTLEINLYCGVKLNHAAKSFANVAATVLKIWIAPRALHTLKHVRDKFICYQQLTFDQDLQHTSMLQPIK